LTHQFDCRRAEEKEMPGAISCSAAIVDDPSQILKERRSAVNLIDNDELANLGVQKCIRILEAPRSRPPPAKGSSASARRLG
jgi:hypothetical protein